MAGSGALFGCATPHLLSVRSNERPDTCYRSTRPTLLLSSPVAAHGAGLSQLRSAALGSFQPLHHLPATIGSASRPRPPARTPGKALPCRERHAAASASMPLAALVASSGRISARYPTPIFLLCLQQQRRCVLIGQISRTSYPEAMRPYPRKLLSSCTHERPRQLPQATCAQRLPLHPKERGRRSLALRHPIQPIHWFCYGSQYSLNRCRVG